MFKYTQTDGILEIQINKGAQKCQNNLKHFYGKNFNRVVLDGGILDKHNNIKQTEFFLRSYNSIIDQLEIKNCIINLNLAVGFFQQITFTNCIFLGTLTDQFHAISLDFFCSLKISALQAGYIEKINITSQTQFIIDFSNTIQMKNLNQLIYSDISLDLSELNGKWKKVKITNCMLSQPICKSFSSEHMQVEVREKNILSLFQNYNFNYVKFIFFGYKHQNLDKLQLISWRQADLLFQYCNIDIKQLRGNFTFVQASYCKLLNNFSSQFSCDIMTLIKCTNSQNFDYNTNILSNINCNYLQIQYNAMVERLPNIKELTLHSCRIRLRNKVPNLEKVLMTHCELQNIEAPQIPALQLLLIPKYEIDNNVQKLQFIIKSNVNRQKYYEYMHKLIKSKQQKRQNIVSRVQLYNREFQYSLQLICNYLYTGYE
ncbi:Hypothetical_protein [Hexamita inflata]|uniref:Hypothetical_protein n=1 Tax=Hexamita inflata TaxID=28002 RepID=A0AA86QRD7_9EUKA|nr:Hypothetical protein HINF_LOCUS44260 [Hexamita inflata]